MIGRLCLRRKRKEVYLLTSVLALLMIVFWNPRSDTAPRQKNVRKFQLLRNQNYSAEQPSKKLLNSTSVQRFNQKQLHPKSLNSIGVQTFNKTKQELDKKFYYFPRKSKVNKHDFELIIHETNVCSDGHSPFLLVLVPSVHSHVNIRKTIRDTWGQVANGIWLNGSYTYQEVKLLFLFGKSKTESEEKIVKKESLAFHDIIQESFIDSYFNLSHKIIGGLKWASLHCPDVRYVLKIDEDTMPHIPNIINYILNSDIPNKHLLGHTTGPGSTVHRSGRWAVSKDAFPFDSYPKYLFGNSYIISADLLKPIVSISEYMPYVPIEDVYVTAILPKVLEAKLKMMRGMTYWLDKPPTVCDYLSLRKLTGTKVTPSLMKNIWQQMQMKGMASQCDKKSKNLKQGFAPLAPAPLKNWKRF